ncbi:MAG: hypothetical protein KDA80_18770, partial [Planctomycetaceae bacterium]|nr:hypothetical protein [Planctomycetaceae bacterium]
MNEAETRAEHIDPALRAAGWGVVEGSRIRREDPITLGRLEGFGRRAKPLIPDYILIYRNTKLATIEAKAWDQKLTEGVAQAKNYAEKLATRFAYSTSSSWLKLVKLRFRDLTEKSIRRGSFRNVAELEATISGKTSNTQTGMSNRSSGLRSELKTTVDFLELPNSLR